MGREIPQTLSVPLLLVYIAIWKQTGLIKLSQWFSLPDRGWESCFSQDVLSAALPALPDPLFVLSTTANSKVKCFRRKNERIKQILAKGCSWIHFMLEKRAHVTHVAHLPLFITAVCQTWMSTNTRFHWWSIFLLWVTVLFEGHHCFAITDR